MEVIEDRYSTIGFLPGTHGTRSFSALKRIDITIYEEDYSHDK